MSAHAARLRRRQRHLLLLCCLQPATAAMLGYGVRVAAALEVTLLPAASLRVAASELGCCCQPLVASGAACRW